MEINTNADIGIEVTEHYHEEFNVMKQRGELYGALFNVGITLDGVSLDIEGRIYQGLMNYESNQGKTKGDRVKGVEGKFKIGNNFNIYSQRKKDIDEAQNVSISGDTKHSQGKTIKIEHVPVDADNHADIIIKPFTGIGYRFHEYNSSGKDINGALGYRMDTQYFYAPIGLSVKKEFNSYGLKFTPEYDLVLNGRTRTFQNEIRDCAKNTNKKMNVGYGGQLSLDISKRFKKVKAGIGTGLKYWFFKNSQSQEAECNQGAIHTPENQTIEGSLNMRLGF